MHSPILGAVIALVLWTCVMWVWLYATRLPAMIRGGIVYDPQQPNSAFGDRLPAQVRWKADNYNHLHEQPTIFYATAIVLAMIGGGAGVDAHVAWAYVALRIAHSIVQAMINKVELRFGLFVLASLALFFLVIRAAMLLWSTSAGG